MYSEHREQLKRNYIMDCYLMGVDPLYEREEPEEEPDESDINGDS